MDRYDRFEAIQDSIQDTEDRYEADRSLANGQITHDQYKMLIEQQTLAKLKREEHGAEEAAWSSKASYERAMVDRADRKVDWAINWMVYSIALLLSSAFAFFVISHGLAVN